MLTGTMNTELLRKVCQTPGAPGFENAIREFIIKEITPLVDSISVDNIGNVIAVKKGKDSSKSIMAAAHMDEIGFIVRHIDDKGFLRILPLGGFDPKTLTAQRVIVHGTKDLLGCMGAKPIHVMTPAERAKMPEVTDFFVDLGLPKEEVEKYVSVGDAITRERELTEMGDCINVKSLDNRAGCYILIETLRALKAAKTLPAYDLYAVFSVQEEVGCRGAQVGALQIQPDFAFALDVTIAYDTPGAGSHEMCTELGKGTAIKIYDSSLIADRRMVAFMKAVSEAENIPSQLELLAAGGTDAGSMQRFTAGGAIAGAISVPVRNVHQVIEMAHKIDLQASVDLLTACVSNLQQWDWNWGAENKPLSKKASSKKADKKPAKKGKK
ncbi:m42 glutamyl aminopeptidase [Akkermansia glycaniphila]|uniref:M42 glutamyl aminopeptidase n=2 Tax=Akkermansia glycaniphila TaxID=1679444 RepID=A0A1H6L052_9BACT|nr:m42 glutamyl aminopeptidase [Akkermansia glycaniphila]